MTAARSLITFGPALAPCEPARRIVDPTPCEVLAFTRRPAARQNRGRIATSRSVNPLTIVTSVPIVEWWRSDFGIAQSGGFVDSWTGALGNQWVGATTARPAYNATDALFSNRPSLQSDGTNDELTCALACPAPGTSPRFYWIIARNITFAATGTLFSGTGGAAHLLFRGGGDAANQLSQFNLTLQQSAANFPVGGAARLIQVSFSNSTADFIKVGASNTTGTNSGNASAASFRMFSFGGGGFAAAAVTEMLITTGAPTAAELASLATYAAALNGLAVNF